MPSVMIRRAASLVLLVFSTLLLAWGLWPLPVQTNRSVIQPIEAQGKAGPQTAAGSLPAPGRAIEVEWPVAVRTGEIFTVRLALLPLDAGSQTGQVPESLGLVEAKLELTGVESAPPGETSQALPADRPVLFVWQARADRAGVYSGMVWLHLRSLPDMHRQILSAPRIEIHARSFLGINGPWARGLGGAGIVLGAVFGLDAAAGVLWQKIRPTRG